MLSTPSVPEFLTAREFLKFFIEINASSIPERRPLDEYFDKISIAPEDRDMENDSFLSVMVCFNQSRPLKVFFR